MNLARKIANEFGRGIAAGFIISFGATVYLMMDNKIVASFLFCFGLFIVSEFDLNLYTGRIGYLATERTGAYLRYVIIMGYLGIFFCVPLFIQSGFEHSIANLYWFMMSGKQWTLSGLWIMLVVMAGNGVGSMVTRLVDHYVLERPQQKAQALAAKANAEEKDSE